MRQFKDDKLPRKNLLSMQIDLNKFAPATDAEKAQHETIRESTTFFRDGMKKLVHNPLAVLSIVLLVALILLIVIAPMVCPYSYTDMVTVNGKRDKSAKNLAPFEYSKMEQKLVDEGEYVFPHIFGTDELCRDYFIRCVYGARVSLRAGRVCQRWWCWSSACCTARSPGYAGGKTDHANDARGGSDLRPAGHADGDTACRWCWVSALVRQRSPARRWRSWAATC